MHNWFSRRRALFVMAAGLPLVLFSVTGCTQQSESQAEQSIQTASLAKAGAPQRDSPLVIKQCGQLHTYKTVPQRVVSSSINITQMLLFLGVGDRLVRYAGAQRRNTGARLKALFRQRPDQLIDDVSMELVLGARADLVVSGWSYGFNKGALTPRFLESFGIDSYVITESCIRVYQRDRVSLRDTLEDLRSLARILGVAPKVMPRIDRLARALENLKQKTAKVDYRPRVFVYDSGRQLPLTAGRFATPHAMIRAAGGRNIFADIESSWETASWEAVVARNPEWIIIIDYGAHTAQEKIEFLLSKESLSRVSAIRHHRFLVIPYAHATPSPYNIYQAQRLAEALHPQLDIEPLKPMTLVPPMDQA